MVFERLKNKEQLYTVVVSLLGMCIFATEVDIHSQSLKDWVLVYILTGSVVLLNLFPIILPPKANSFSMDSAVYLATLFLYGLNFTLQVLFIFSFDRIVS